MTCFYSASSRQLCRTKHVSEFRPSASASTLCPVGSPSLQECRERSLAVFCGSDEEPQWGVTTWSPRPLGVEGRFCGAGVCSRGPRGGAGVGAHVVRAGSVLPASPGLAGPWEGSWGSRSSRMGQGSGVQCGVQLTLPFEARRGWPFEVCLVEACLLAGFTLLSLQVTQPRSAFWINVENTQFGVKLTCLVRVCGFPPWKRKFEFSSARLIN